MIVSFRNLETAALASGHALKRFGQIGTVARRKMRQLEIARSLRDLAIPPGNRLKALAGERSGQHSIRINDQYRICFHWTPAAPEDVEVVDYH